MSGRRYGDLPIRGSRGGSDRGRGRGDRGYGSDRGRGGDRGRGERGGGGGGGGRGREPELPSGMLTDPIPPPNPQVHNFEDEYVAKSLKTAPLQNTLARRPGYGTLGRAIIVRADFFDIDFKPGVKFHSYRIKAKPDNMKRGHQKFAIDRLLRDYAPLKGIGVATDGATEIVTTERLPDNLPIFKFTMPNGNGRGKGRGAAGRSGSQNYNGPWEMRLVHKCSHSAVELRSCLRDSSYRADPKSPMEGDVVRMLNILMTAYPFKTPGVHIVGKGRNKVFRIDDRKQSFDMKGGVEAIRGYYSSVRLVAGRIMLNLNISHAPFYKPTNLVTTINEFSAIFSQDRVKLNGYVKGLKVYALHLPTRENGAGKMEKPVKTIWGLATPRDGPKEYPAKVKQLGSSANNVRFYWNKDDGNSEYVTITDYFLQSYNRRLNVPATCPVVNVGNQQNPVYLPAEVCEVLPGQVFGGEPDNNMRSAMIKFSCRRPPQNYASIMSEGLDIMGISNEKTKEVALKPSTEMITVPARILNAPSLLYAKKSTKVQFGSWNLVRTRFSEGATIKKWTCLSLRRRGPNEPIRDSAPEMEALFKKSREHGLNLSPPSKPYHGVDLVSPSKYSGNVQRADSDNRDLIEGKLKALYGQGFELVVVLLPDTNGRVFDWVKYIGDVKTGILTHCMLAEKFKAANDQYISNNVMKINLKMGGCNQVLDTSGAKFIGQGKTMIVGLDVTHPPSTDDPGMPSIAGIVASIDGRMGQWPGEVRTQTRRQENIEYLKEMMEERIKLWGQQNNQLPSNILIYRDGVSEGQFDMVLADELPKVRDAIGSFKDYRNKPPKVAILVCGKRHHVRFYPTQAKDQDRTSNPINGCVVDRGVTRPSVWDFYLQAQSPLQGSARPAHYIVVHDEIFTNSQITQGAKPADLVQELTHNICYMMGRATRSISYATPAFLADRFCDRARKYLLAWIHEAGGDDDAKKDRVRNASESVKTFGKFPRSMVYI